MENPCDRSVIREAAAALVWSVVAIADDSTWWAQSRL